MGDSEEIVETAPPVLSKYQILERVGVGGMGSVYLAQRHGTTDLCIVKVINEELLDNDVVAQRFLREAHVASNLSHENIAQVTDAGREGGRFYLAVEFIAGQEFEALMRQLMLDEKLVPPGLTLTMAQDVLRGLHFAHSAKDSNGQHLQIVHRDLSPRNVMMTFDGHAKVIDFGLVRTTLGEWRTRPGMLLGTLRYMSPEQATATPVDHRSDIYSIATVLHEALSGRFFIPDGTQFEVLTNVVNLEPEPLSDLNPNLPAALTSVLAKALSKVSEERYESAEEFRAALFDAAPELSSTPRSHIAKFLGEQFPEHKAWTERVIARARNTESTLVRDAPEFEATRAGFPGMADADAPNHEVTRAASRAELGADADAPTEPAPGADSPPPPKPPRDRWLKVGVGVLAGIAAILVAVVLSRGPPSQTVQAELPAPAAPPPPATAAATPRSAADEPLPLVQPPPLAPPTAPSRSPGTKRRVARRAPAERAPPPAPPPAADPAPTGPKALIAEARRKLRAGQVEAAKALAKRAVGPSQWYAVSGCWSAADLDTAENPEYGQCLDIADQLLETGS